MVLSLDGEMSQRELAERLNLTPPSITAAIQKMEKMDYIKRTPDPHDQRVLRLSLTEKSRAYPGAYQRSEQTDRGTDLQRDEYRRKTSAPAAFDASKRQSGRGKISGYLEASDQVIKGF